MLAQRVGNVLVKSYRYVEQNIKIVYKCMHTNVVSIVVTIVTRDMVWKLSKLQSVYNELQFNAETASPCTNLLKFC